MTIDGWTDKGLSPPGPLITSRTVKQAMLRDLPDSGIDYLVSSSNKCIEGVPGLGFILARRAARRATEGWSRTVSLNIHDQWRGLESNGQFRFTPPTHGLLAFRLAAGEKP